MKKNCELKKLNGSRVWKVLYTKEDGCYNVLIAHKDYGIYLYCFGLPYEDFSDLDSFIDWCELGFDDSFWDSYKYGYRERIMD